HARTNTPLWRQRRLSRRALRAIPSRPGERRRALAGVFRAARARGRRARARTDPGGDRAARRAGTGRGDAGGHRGRECPAGGNVGAEFAHMSDSEERLWLQDEFQQGRLEHRFSPEEQRNILWQLTAAEGLERYLHTKYIGQKRFSLEGADAFIPLLDDLIQGG